MLNMIASIDGASAVDGASGGLGGPGDRTIFFVLRALADVILVGASTVRAEGYGPPKKQAQRVAVVTRSGNVDWSSALFTSGAGLAIVPEDAPSIPVPSIRAGRGDVDLQAAVRQLEGTIVLCEGGPTLNGQLFAAGLVDELCLTISPRVVGGDAHRIIAGPSASADMRARSPPRGGRLLVLPLPPPLRPPPRWFAAQFVSAHRVDEQAQDHGMIRCWPTSSDGPPLSRTSTSTRERRSPVGWSRRAINHSVSPGWTM